MTLKKTKHQSYHPLSQGSRQLGASLQPFFLFLGEEGGLQATRLFTPHLPKVNVLGHPQPGAQEGQGQTQAFLVDAVLQARPGVAGDFNACLGQGRGG